MALRFKKKTPKRSGVYVALGSSFASGIGLGPRDTASPFLCMRTTGGYPHRLAEMLGVSLVDMTCSGSTTAHILRGGQFLREPQLAAVAPNTKLVTITSGGNDVGYVGDLVFASGRTGVFGWFRGKPKPLAKRDFASLTTNLVTIVEKIKTYAPDALIVLVSYPNIVPSEGTCSELGVDRRSAEIAREVAGYLHTATRTAAKQSGALFIDMASVSTGHDVCSTRPWVNGATPASGAPFHPNVAGAKATAEAIFLAVSGIIAR